MDLTRDDLSGRNKMKTEVRVKNIHYIIIPDSPQAYESGLLLVELGKNLANGFFQRDSFKLTFAMVEAVESVELVELGIKEIINFVFFPVFRGL